jgi:HEAT repeat protein
MLRYFLIGICFFAFSACSSEPVLNLEELEANARGGDPQAIEQLVGLLASEESGLSDRIYAMVVEIGERAVPALLSRVQDENKQVREYVIAALGTLKVVDAIPAISEVLANKSLERRYVAAWALGDIGDATAVPALLSALDDENSEVQAEQARRDAFA